ncbi:MAG: hypothetical protein M0P95_15525 [Sulfuritalea sp.]|jgi:hypothetical protein|nr:hypothetical protein [Sulfuritalea sp.]
MKTPILLAAVVGCALSVPALSAQEKVAPGKPAMSMATDKQTLQMQENMKKMQQQMEQFRATTDPAERQKLMQAHMQTMQENMQTMHGMDGAMMKGDKKHGMAGSAMMQHHAMTEKRLDMMQTMMEQLMQHQQAMESMLAR